MPQPNRAKKHRWAGDDLQSRWSEEPRLRPSRLRMVVQASSLVVACGLAPAALALTPRPGQPVVVLTLSPDAPIPRAVAESGAPILWLSSGGHVAVVHADGRDVASDLRRHGAYLIASAGPLGGCFPGLRFSSTYAQPSMP